jgi:etoposide-induced 2.4 mRNA
LGLSFVINPQWLTKLSAQVVPQSHASPTARKAFVHPFNLFRPKALSRLLSSLVYENTFFIPFLFQSTLSLLIPFLGRVVNFTLLCWLYSLYCFEYKWANWDVMKRLKFIEDNWAYFVGFGMVVAAPFLIVSAYFGIWVGYAMWWIEFPFVRY